MDWDLTSYFPAFNGPEYAAFKKQLVQDHAALTEKLDSLREITSENLAEWSQWLCDHENAVGRLTHLSSYVGCLSAADASNEAVQKDEGWLSELESDFRKLDAALNSAIGRASDATFTALLAQPGLSGAEYSLKLSRHKARFQMPDEFEALASELDVYGLNAWSRLYNTLSGQIKFDYVDENGKTQTAPMGQRISLITGKNRAVRESAFKGANQAWDQHAASCNAALNAIAGARLALDKRRKVGHFLDNPCFTSRVERPTLDAMFQAIADNIELPREILKFRARQMGLERVSMWDFYAPLDIPNQEAISWESGTALIKKSFDQAYPALGGFMQEVLDKKWTDYSPRDNKRPGGFCTGSPVTRESRIFMTFKDTMSAVLTMAHEVGHAWHSRVMKDVRLLGSDYPMTLAESASTFAELILADGVISSDDSSEAQKLALLDSELGHSAAFLLDIPWRYHWERRFYEERQEGIVSVSRMKEIMVEEQTRQLGDALDPAGADPYFWCSKLHFYIDGIMFYNFPYTFGYLLSCSLFARFKEEGRGFLKHYEKFLEKSGSMPCEQIVAEILGENIQDTAFWTRAIQSHRKPFEKMKTLLSGQR